jgi:hypothetical protein
MTTEMEDWSHVVGDMPRGTHFASSTRQHQISRNVGLLRKLLRARVLLVWLLNLLLLRTQRVN